MSTPITLIESVIARLKECQSDINVLALDLDISEKEEEEFIDAKFTLNETLRHLDNLNKLCK